MAEEVKAHIDNRDQETLLRVSSSGNYCPIIEAGKGKTLVDNLYIA